MSKCTCFNDNGMPHGDGGCLEHPRYIRIALLRANHPDEHNQVFASEALVHMHDGKRLFYDVTARVLWWFGPLHECMHPVQPRAHITVPTAVHVHLTRHHKHPHGQ